MADSGGEVLKEFLVSLGFKLDASAQEKMQGALGEVTRSVIKLGEVFAATQAAVELAVVAISKRMEEIYFAAQRAGASAQNLLSLRYAAEQVGVGAEAVTSAITGMRMAMLQNPGTEQMINMLGVQTRVQGKMRDTEEVFGDLLGKLSKMPFYLAAQYASMVGIGADTLMMLEQHYGELAKYQQQYNDELGRAGLNQNSVASTSHDLMTRLRELGMQFDVLTTTIMMRLAPGYRWFIDQSTILIHWLEDLDKKTRGWSTTIGTTLVAALVALSVAWRLFNLSVLATPIGAAVAGITALGLAVYALVQDFDKWRSGGDSLIPWAKWKPQIDEAVRGIEDLWSVVTHTLAPALAKIQTAFDDLISAFSEFVSGPGASAASAFDKLDISVSAILRSGIFIAFRAALIALRDMLSAVADSLEVVADLLRGHWTNAWTDAMKIAHDVWDAGVGQILKAAEDFGGNLVKNIEAGVAKGWDDFESYFADLVHKLFGILPDWANPFAGAGASEMSMHPESGGPHQTGERDPGVLRSLWNSLTGGDTNPKMPEGKTKDAMAFFQHMGWTADQAAGIVANLVQESGLNPEAVGDNGTSFGLAQMHNERAADMIAWIKSQGLNPKDFRAQLEYIQHDLTEGAYKSVGDALHKIHNAQESGELVSHDYEQPADTLSEMSRRGLMATKIISNQAVAPSWMNAPPRGPANATLNQKTEIHVSGTGDALTTARHVADAQNRVNGDLTRNLVGALDVAPAGAG